jgi:hypothetical protein
VLVFVKSTDKGVSPLNGFAVNDAATLDDCDTLIPVFPPNTLEHPFASVMISVYKPAPTFVRSIEVPTVSNAAFSHTYVKGAVPETVVKPVMEPVEEPQSAVVITIEDESATGTGFTVTTKLNGVPEMHDPGAGPTGVIAYVTVSGVKPVFVRASEIAPEPAAL